MYSQVKSQANVNVWSIYRHHDVIGHHVNFKMAVITFNYVHYMLIWKQSLRNVINHFGAPQLYDKAAIAHIATLLTNLYTKNKACMVLQVSFSVTA